MEADFGYLLRYTSVAAFPILYVAWKAIHRTKIYPPAEVDLQQDLDEVEEYTRNYIPNPPRYV